MPYDLPSDIERIVEAVQKAPSILNTRPWWFEFRPPDHVDLWLRGDPRQSLPPNTARARTREYVISCGAALFDLRMTIRMAGHDLVVWLLPDPKHADPMRPPALLASVEIVIGRVKKPSIAEQELYEAIGRRHTNRSPYVLPVPLPIIADMEHAAAQEGAYLRLLHPREAKRWLRQTRAVDGNPAFTPPFTNFVSRENSGPLPAGRAVNPAEFLAEGDAASREAAANGAVHGRRRASRLAPGRSGPSVRRPDRNLVFRVGPLRPGRPVPCAAPVWRPSSPSSPEAR